MIVELSLLILLMIKNEFKGKHSLFLEELFIEYAIREINAIKELVVSFLAKLKSYLSYFINLILN